MNWLAETERATCFQLAISEIDQITQYLYENES